MADEFDPKHDYEETGRSTDEDATDTADDDEFEDLEDTEEDEGDLES
jgi:hypothetical protein